MWNIDFNRETAENVLKEISNGKHLSGFPSVEEKLNKIMNMLHGMEKTAENMSSNCIQAAECYSKMQKDLDENSESYSYTNAQKILRKSPETLYAYAKELNVGAYELSKMQESVREILSKVEHAESDAQKFSQNEINKITYAINLMDKYLFTDI